MMTPFIAPHYSNADRLILYKRRIADYAGSNPQNFHARYMEGLAIQARLHRPKPAKLYVLALANRKVK